VGERSEGGGGVCGLGLRLRLGNTVTTLRRLAEVWPTVCACRLGLRKRRGVVREDALESGCKAK